MFRALPDSIRYIEPRWDFVPSGEPLYPFWHYWFNYPPSDETASLVAEKDNAIFEGDEDIIVSF